MFFEKDAMRPRFDGGGFAALVNSFARVLQITLPRGANGKRFDGGGRPRRWGHAVARLGELVCTSSTVYITSRRERRITGWGIIPHYGIQDAAVCGAYVFSAGHFSGRMMR